MVRGLAHIEYGIHTFENDRINLGVERAKTLARVLKCHPAVLVFPGWELPDEHAA